MLIINNDSNELGMMNDANDDMHGATTAKAQIDAVAKKLGSFGSVAEVIRALPHKIIVSSACTGSGMLELAMNALIFEINEQFVCEEKNILEAFS